MGERRVFWTMLMEREVSVFAVQALVRIAGRCARDGFNYIALPYTRTDDARNTACLALARATQDDRDTLVMLDCDHEHPPDIVRRLVAHDVGVVGALYFRRSEPYDAMCFVRGEDGQLHTPAEWDADAGLTPVAMVGTAAIAIRAGVFKRLMAAGFRWPFFRYQYAESDAVQPTEDVYFGAICEQAGIPHHVDFSLVTPHLAMSRVDREAFEKYKTHPLRRALIEVEEEEAGERPEWMGRWDTIDGWLTHQEATYLFTAARDLPAGSDIVEIGTWHGRSAVALGMGARENRCRVVSIDHYLGSAEHVQPPSFERAQANVAEFGLGDTVELIRGNSAAAAESWEREIGLLFIDASHDAEAVYADARAWLRHCRAGATVLFHDYDVGWPGVTTAVQRLEGEGWLTVEGTHGSIGITRSAGGERC